MQSTTAFSVPVEDARCALCGGDALARPCGRARDFEYGSTGRDEWTYWECRGCDSITLHPRPGRAALGRIYPDNYYAFDFSRSRGLGYQIKALLDKRAARSYLAHDPGEGRVCDIGAGDGRLLSALREAGVPDHRLHGVEPSERAAEAARERGLEVRACLLEDFPWEPETHALVIMQQVIEHVQDPRRCIETLASALAPGGALIVETPSTHSLDRLLFGRRHWGGYHCPRHFHLFSPPALRALLVQCGLEVVCTQALSSPSFWVQSLHHALEESGRRSLAGFFSPHPASAAALALATLADLPGRLLGHTSNMRVVARKPVVASC